MLCYDDEHTCIIQLAVGYLVLLLITCILFMIFPLRFESEKGKKQFF